LGELIQIQIGSALFDRAAQRLQSSEGSVPIALRAQSMRVLELLLDADGAMLSKDQLVEAVWGRVAVTDGSLVQCVREIRLAIGDPKHLVLQTVHRRGYRLVPSRATIPNQQQQSEATEVRSPTVQSSRDITIPVVAVLKFSSFDGDERSEQAAANFAGDLTNQLARQSELRLIGRNSAFALNPQGLSTQSICNQLGAHFLITGQIQLNDERASWSLELVNGLSDEIVWSEREQLEYSDREGAISELVWRLAGTIPGYLDYSVRQNLGARDPESLGAYELCERVYTALFKTTIDGTEEAHRIAQRAVELYPNYARAWRVLTHARNYDSIHCLTGRWHADNVGELLKGAHKTIELDASNAYGFAALAMTLCSNGQFEEALFASNQSVAMAPGGVAELQHRAMIQFFRGDLNDSARSCESIMQSSAIVIHTVLAAYGRTLLFLGRVDEGVKLLRETLTLCPGSNWARMPLIVALHETGDTRLAREHFAALQANTTNLDGSYFGLRWSAIPSIRDRYLRALSAYGLKPDPK
jgi:DNA-binding winged helix-turn-helix (wHTH) protein/tetratricopeptide (TPR) repeat protein